MGVYSCSIQVLRESALQIRHHKSDQSRDEKRRAIYQFQQYSIRSNDEYYTRHILLFIFIQKYIELSQVKWKCLSKLLILFPTAQPATKTNRNVTGRECVCVCVYFNYTNTDDSSE